MKQMGSRLRNVDPTMKQRIHEIEEDPTSGDARPEFEPSPDIIIVGAGVAGAALAYTLGKDGRQVRVIERDLSEPDRIVGEVLQPGGYLKLMDLGLQARKRPFAPTDGPARGLRARLTVLHIPTINELSTKLNWFSDCVENIDARRMIGYAVCKDGKYAELPYAADVAGRSFHNGRFIQKMRDKADTLPNVKLTQGTVTSLLEENGTVRGVQYRTKEGRELKAYAPLTIVCDGCFSNLRRSLCTSKVDILSSFVGLILENCEVPFENYGHIILANPSPILFYSISSNEVRCLVDVPGQKLPSLANGEMAKYLRTVVAPQVPQELHNAFISAVDKGIIRTMRNTNMPAPRCPKPGALLIGDAFNMRHALTGGGMTVALYDIVVIRNLLRNLRDLKDTDTLCKHLQSFYTLRKPVAFTVNTLAGASYKLCCASADQGRNEMHDVFFGYLSTTGFCSKGPVSLLCGRNLHPLNLLLNFSAGAIYAVGRLFIPYPTPKRLWSGVRLILGASAIILPVIKAEGVKEMLCPFTAPAYYSSQKERISKN
ncbi:Squalene epoxidase 1 [Castilleja foliolosa]|uniref:Squalene monooxygenase n=1 Tax=Castilleja foliolosa TaxID=1961234 RepID=A0ABD3DGT2_9LAMI